jgi:mannose-6-phosphate isomerase-like protein (cupin superfamily)
MRVTALALLIPALLGSISGLALAEPVGEATRVQRFAYQTPPQAAQAPLHKLDPVVRNAKLETVPSGALEVKFTDGSRLTLGSASSVVVDNYVYGGGQNNQTLKMTRGVFRFVSGSMPKDQVKLKTPSVTIGIRGTVVKVSTNDETNEETIFFEQGTGFIDDDGKIIEMGEGDMIKVKNGEAGAPENKSWNAGDAAVDHGMGPFGPQGGPDGGTGGGDGAGSSGEGRGNTD